MDELNANFEDALFVVECTERGRRGLAARRFPTRSTNFADL